MKDIRVSIIQCSFIRLSLKTFVNRLDIMTHLITLIANQRIKMRRQKGIVGQCAHPQHNIRQLRTLTGYNFNYFFISSRILVVDFQHHPFSISGNVEFLCVWPFWMSRKVFRPFYFAQKLNLNSQMFQSKREEESTNITRKFPMKWPLSTDSDRNS